MCLGVPMRVKEIENLESGRCELEGTTYTVNLSLIDKPQVDDFVIVHAGYAIERLDPDEANERIAMFEEIAQQHAEHDAAMNRTSPHEAE